jgi:hypothetical protein
MAGTSMNWSRHGIDVGKIDPVEHGYATAVLRPELINFITYNHPGRDYFIIMHWGIIRTIAIQD